MIPKLFSCPIAKVCAPSISNLSICWVGNSLGGASSNQSCHVPAVFSRSLHFSSPRCKEKDRKYYVQTSLPRDEGTDGEKTTGIDRAHRRKDIFPDENTPDLIFDGLKFKDLPVLNIRVSKNNTILSLSDAKGAVKLLRSCGMEGFKNARKGTNIAAQAAAITIGKKSVDLGVTSVRINVQGLGPGRLASIKGLEMTGLNIVSITDSTRCSEVPPRPRKQRKI
uniref:28S ribosomal protein S11, mitochondrial n=1 Tax=Cacopsylla melanoneura TaxID=428564 RepID=A0A8D8SM01_9HEMI